MAALFWFRRDLRLEDNRGLYEALRSNETVHLIFIFDSHILKRLQNKNDRRVQFIYAALKKIQNQLLAYNAQLHVFYGTPEDIIVQFCKSNFIKAVYTNHDYEPYARKRDATVQAVLSENGVAFYSHKDQCIFEKHEIVKPDGTPYTVFTPYSKSWHKRLTQQAYQQYDTKPFLNRISKGDTHWPELEDMGFISCHVDVKGIALPSQQLLTAYAKQRDLPAIHGTSRISMALRFGCISIRAALAHALPHSAAWVNELIWRDFYMMILWHFPYVVEGPFKPAYRNIPWRHDEHAFELWCMGKTGFPIVDAGMRELNQTGFMHNRVRMIVSSFLVKDLLIDWRWGEAYFAEQLNDFDLSANNGGWQWAAGTGCDAAPYFRVFNPNSQQQKFDPKFEYIRKWVPEFETGSYPKPIVDHAAARLRTIEVYRNALNEYRQLQLEL